MPVVPNFATLLLNGIAFSVLRPHHSLPPHNPPPQKKVQYFSPSFSSHFMSHDSPVEKRTYKNI